MNYGFWRHYQSLIELNPTGKTIDWTVRLQMGRPYNVPIKAREARGAQVCPVRSYRASPSEIEAMLAK